MPAVAKPADVLWLNPDDIYSDLARYQMARGYATFLKSRHLCVEELLHHPAGGLELVNAWQAMQAGLQPIALMQAHVMELSGPERVRELTKMLEELFQTLALEQKNNPPEIPSTIGMWLPKLYNNIDRPPTGDPLLLRGLTVI